MSNKLFVPEIGTKIRLTKDWPFKLFNERRNNGLLATVYKNVQDIDLILNGYWRRDEESQQKTVRKLNSLGITDVSSMPDGVAFDFSLSAGTELKLDRIYVRSGANSFSSLSFVIMSCPSDKALEKKRFWAKLYDCNQIEFDLVEDKVKNPFLKTVLVKGTVATTGDILDKLKKRKHGNMFYFELKDASGKMILSKAEEVYDWSYSAYQFPKHHAKFLTIRLWPDRRRYDKSYDLEIDRSDRNLSLENFKVEINHTATVYNVVEKEIDVRNTVNIEEMELEQ